MIGTTTSSPAFGARLRNTIRVEIAEQSEEVRKKLFNRYFVEKLILMNLFEVQVGELFCVQTFEGAGFVDVTTFHVKQCERICEKWKELEGHPVLEGLRLRKLYSQGTIPVYVQMFNPHVEDEDIMTYLRRFCTVVKGAEKMLDEYGVWNGRRRFMVRLRDCPERPGEVEHLPGGFSLGSDRGYIRYATQPIFCRRCGETGHLKDKCSGQGFVCRFCGKQGHMAKDCPMPKACSLCGSGSHLFRECPLRKDSYASRAGGSERREGRKERMERETVEGLREVLGDDAVVDSLLVEAAAGCSDQELLKAMEEEGGDSVLAQRLADNGPHGDVECPLEAESGAAGSEVELRAPESPLSPPGGAGSQSLFSAVVSETPDGRRPKEAEPEPWDLLVDNAEEEQRAAREQAKLEQQQMVDFDRLASGGKAGETEPGVGGEDEEMPESAKGCKRPAEACPGQPKHPRAGVGGSGPDGSESESGGAVPPEGTAKELIDLAHADLDRLDPEVPGETLKVADSPEAKVTGEEEKVRRPGVREALVRRMVEEKASDAQICAALGTGLNIMGLAREKFGISEDEWDWVDMVRRLWPKDW